MKDLYFVEASVVHSRAETAENSFRYPVLNVYFPVNLQTELKSMFHKKFAGLLGLNSMGYLNNEKSSLQEKIVSYVNKHFNYQPQSVYLQTIPKMFGYAFNPVSFWYFHKDDHLDAVLCEVNNTFGEKHCYWLYHDGKDLNNKWIQTKKEFHVSPFFKVDGIYRFKFKIEPDKTHVQIQVLNEDNSLKLHTSISGSLKPAENFSLFRLIYKYGWFTPLVVLRIHYQAIKLFFKKVQFYTKPKPPLKEVTDESSIVGG